MSTVAFNCFNSPAATLPPLEQLIVRVIRDSRVPMKLHNIWSALCRLDGAVHLFTADRKERVEIAILRVEDAGLAKETAKGWVRA